MNSALETIERSSSKKCVETMKYCTVEFGAELKPVSYYGDVLLRVCTEGEKSQEKRTKFCRK